MAENKETRNASSNKRPENYTKQQGVKAILTLADFQDDQLFAEL